MGAGSEEGRLTRAPRQLWLLALLAARLAQGASCESLAKLALPDTTIEAATHVASLGGYCRVQGVIAPSIRFEVHLPDAWNGKLQGVGNGAFAGTLNAFGLANGVARGYATASTDTGHSGLDGRWALGRPDLVEDFGHRAIHVTTVAAKAIVEAYYGASPARSYFVGCSTGGKQGLTEAQRYPEDYDGILAVAPANFFTHLMVAVNWTSQALYADPASAIPSTKLPAIAAAVLVRCDARDGVVDGVVDDPRRCRFRARSLRCSGAESDACLTAAQVVALEKVYAGPRTSKGKRIYPGYLPGGELRTPTDPGPAGEPSLGGWETWLLGTMPGFAHPIQDTFYKYLVFQDPAWDWRTLDFDRDVKPTDAKLAGVLNATDPDLRPFRDRGGKLLLVHGWSDAAISALNTVDYWEQVVRVMRGRRRTDAFLRLFLVPGMQHCAGGPGPTVFDGLGALEQWVEHGVAPDRIVAAHQLGGVVARTRPLCPHPRVARWDGRGDTDDAASFRCASPRR